MGRGGSMESRRLWLTRNTWSSFHGFKPLLNFLVRMGSYARIPRRLRGAVCTSTRVRNRGRVRSALVTSYEPAALRKRLARGTTSSVITDQSTSPVLGRPECLNHRTQRRTLVPAHTHKGAQGSVHMDANSDSGRTSRRSTSQSTATDLRSSDDKLHQNSVCHSLRRRSCPRRVEVEGKSNRTRDSSLRRASRIPSHI